MSPCLHDVILPLLGKIGFDHLHLFPVKHTNLIVGNLVQGFLNVEKYFQNQAAVYSIMSASQSAFADAIVVDAELQRSGEFSSYTCD